MIDIEKFLPVENKMYFYFKLMLNRVERNTKIIIVLLVALLVMLLFSRCSGVKVSHPVDSIAKVDSNLINIDSCDAKIFAAQVQMFHTKDSLDNLRKEFAAYKDSITIVNKGINEDLFVANFKLTRIREYNRIAGQRNNIKYLRGWINRVLKD